jgi:hypothetical protein
MSTTHQLNPDNRSEAKGVGRGFLTCLAIEAAAFLVFAGGLYLFWCK